MLKLVPLRYDPIVRSNGTQGGNNVKLKSRDLNSIVPTNSAEKLLEQRIENAVFSVANIDTMIEEAQQDWLAGIGDLSDEDLDLGRRNIGPMLERLNGLEYYTLPIRRPQVISTHDQNEDLISELKDKVTSIQPTYFLN